LFLCGAFVWARRALNSHNRRFPARAGAGQGQDGAGWQEGRRGEAVGARSGSRAGGRPLVYRSKSSLSNHLHECTGHYDHSYGRA
jgi:hypothetical protein